MCGTGSTLKEARAPAAPTAATPGSRIALWVFVGVEVLAIPVLLAWGGRHLWFAVDDWDLLSQRTIGNVGDLFRPHYQHWVTAPVVAYRIVWWAVGLRSYAAYELLVVTAHLVVAALLRVVMRRAGVAPWIATALAVLFVCFGSGAENILVAFQFTFVGALAFGLGHLVLSDHDGPFGRRDWWGLAAGLGGLLCSGVALTMIGVVGLTMLLRRGWRIAIAHTVPLAGVYLIWFIAAPSGQPTAGYRANSLSEVARFVLIGVQALFGGLSGWRGFGIVAGAVLVGGLAVFVARNGMAALGGSAAATFALLAGALVFLVVTGVNRAGQGGFLNLFVGTGPERARQSRYVYVVAAMTLPALALAADALVRYWRRAGIVLAAVVVVAIIGNVTRLHDFTETHASRAFVLTAPRLPIARQLPRTTSVTNGLQIGWLLDQLPSGRIPAAPDLLPVERSTLTLKLALAPGGQPVTSPCESLTEPVLRDMAPNESLTIHGGPVSITYVPLDDAQSLPQRAPPSTVTVRAVPLRLAIAPAGPHVVLCG